MPAYNKYGTWPASGEIDLVESRGNKNMFLNGLHIGTQVITVILYIYKYSVFILIHILIGKILSTFVSKIEVQNVVYRCF